MQARASARHDPWPYPFWIAHRGAGKLAPENTLAAFRLGAEYGYRMLECDAKLSADGVPFLLHDSTLQRTSNGHGVAGERAWSELTPARRRRLAFAPLRRRAACQPRSPDPLLPRQQLRAQHRDQADAGRRTEHRRTRRAARRSAVGRLGRRAAPPDLLRARIPGGCAVCPARTAARPAARHAAGGLARHRAPTRLRGDRLQLCAVGRRHRGAGACRRLARAELYRQRRVVGEAADRARHRRHHHRPRRSIQSCGLSPRAGRMRSPSMMKP